MDHIGEFESWGWKKRTHGSVLQPASFQRRYMRIEKGALSYYKRPSDVEPRGTITIETIIRIFPSDPSDVGKSKPAKDFGLFALSLSTSTRTFHFLLESESDFDLAIISLWSCVQQGQCTLHAKLRGKLNLGIANTTKNKATVSSLSETAIQISNTSSLSSHPSILSSVSQEIDTKQTSQSTKSDKSDIYTNIQERNERNEPHQDTETDDIEYSNQSEPSTAPSKSRWLRSMFPGKKGTGQEITQEVELQTRSPIDIQTLSSTKTLKSKQPKLIPKQPLLRSQNGNKRKQELTKTQQNPNSPTVIKRQTPTIPFVRGTQPLRRGQLSEKLLDDNDDDDDDDEDDEEEEEDDDYDDDYDDDDDDDDDDDNDNDDDKKTCCTVI
jgi:trigger factor